ncbi:MAG: hypothetical protein LBV69_08015, partial [Bacteroidales bacterium]|nr:hypothetical protein [Bacteroidales bacterium]
MKEKSINSQYYFVYDFDKVKILIVQDGQGISKITYNLNLFEGECIETELIKKTFYQLNEYLEKKRNFFNIP